MEKEIIIPQGLYEIGVDFPEGSYIFDSMNKYGTLEIFDQKKLQKSNLDNYYDDDDDIERYFVLGTGNGFQCKVVLKKKDCLKIDFRAKVSKVKKISFED